MPTGGESCTSGISHGFLLSENKFTTIEPASALTSELAALTRVAKSSEPFVGPFSAFASGVDFNGDGTQNDLLPGARVNQFNRGLGRDDLARLVERYNQEFAGKPLPNGQPAPPLTLPCDYAFNDSFPTQDLRLSRTFPLGGERVRLNLFGEVFNLLNTAKLVGYGRNLSNPAEFGQPGAHFTQVFGSGGPRAFQFGARISFRVVASGRHSVHRGVVSLLTLTCLKANDDQ